MLIKEAHTGDELADHAATMHRMQPAPNSRMANSGTAGLMRMDLRFFLHLWMQTAFLL